MNSILIFTVGLLLGGIITFWYLWKQGSNLKEILADNMVKNQLLKQELKKSPKKSWNKSKKRYYNGNKKKATSSKS